MRLPSPPERVVRLVGVGQNLSAFCCRSSEMLLASLVAITRNGCARSAFQPHLAGVFAFWVRTKTCPLLDRKSTRLNSSHGYISYAVFCLKKKNTPTFLFYL